MDKKKIVFLTGTRAEFGKLKPILDSLTNDDHIEVHLFVTGMHLLSKYGSTVYEVFKTNMKNVYMYNNQVFASKMDVVLSNTIYGFSNYIDEIKPDMIVVHGDRVETLAGAIVGSFNNILVTHIEGGELSGTIDELIRHSVTKLSHVHFVANEEAKNRLIQMGEREQDTYIIGSPDIDVMFSSDLPAMQEVKSSYQIPFEEYAVFIYHSVTTDLDNLANNVKAAVDAAVESNFNYVVVFPNNDKGSDVIFEELKRVEGNDWFKVFPSIRFESFLSLLREAKFIIGNSSCGVREAPVYSVPTINLGSRQHNRYHHESIFNAKEEKGEILEAIQSILEGDRTFPPSQYFGDGNSIERVLEILKTNEVWQTKTQKQFVDQANYKEMLVS